MRGRILAAGVGLGAVCAVMTTAPVRADTSASVVTAEAWYQPNPGALPLPPTTPYPAGTMHVAQAAGQELARVYLALHNPAAHRGQVVGGQLTIPLDTDTTDGSASPESAQLLVCTTTAKVTSVEGSFDAPPASDCGVGVQAVYAATPRPQLVADLYPLAAALAKRDVGLVLTPVLGLPQTDAWHVVFSSHTRVNPPTPGLSVTLTYSDRPAPAPGLPSVPVGPSVSPGTVPPGPEPGVAPLPSLRAEAPAAVPLVAESTPPSTTVTALTVVGHPYRHPEIWYLPMVLFVVVPLVNRALARDLSVS